MIFTDMEAVRAGLLILKENGMRLTLRVSYGVILTLAVLAMTRDSCASLPVGTSKSGADLEFQKGVSAYKKQQYKEAADIFEQLITNKKGNATAWLYLGHARYASGNQTAAAYAYKVIKNSYPGTPEAKLAEQCMQKLETSTAPKTSSVPSTQPSSLAYLQDRLEVVQPQYGHVAVTAANVKAIKEAIRNLPANVGKILKNSETSFCISPTMEERFPNFLRQEREGFPGRTNATVGGLVNNNVVHVFQSKCDETTNRPLEVRTADDLAGTFLHECGHALDADLAYYARSDDFRRAYYSDLDEMPESVNSKIRSFSQKTAFSQSEACAELTSILLGGNRPNADELKTYLPKTVKVIKAQLGL
jgi:tetratricopeptide (TPR) repeat protein